MARVGGSWAFLLSLIGGLAFWVILNGAILTASNTSPFDPFPFILLNLFLSCLAALQAPIIMMSQNRQDAKDREVNEFVSKVILRNEHQTRHVNAKIDHLLSFQWKRLLEIQEIQTVLLQIQRHEKGSVYKKAKQKSTLFSIELVPDNFSRFLLRHAIEVDSSDDTLLFSHWHEEGDNFPGLVDNVLPIFSKLKLCSLKFDIIFNHHAVSLDDIISGDNRLVLRNDFGLPHMNLSGQISKVELYLKNQTMSFYARDLPQRYKPAYALYVTFFHKLENV